MLMAGMSSCQDWFDVSPKADVKAEDMFEAESGFRDILTGVYGLMIHENLYGRQLTFGYTDVLAQYYNQITTQEHEYIKTVDFKYNEPVDKAVIEKIWSTQYKAIANLNTLLAYIDKKQEVFSSDAIYRIYKGEALGLRAFMHFDLLRIFSEQITQNPEAAGIPYATQFSLTAPEFLKAKDVYTRIKNDLKEAEKLLNDPELYSSATAIDNYLKDQSTHFNLQAVQGTLARVYLTENNIDSALYYAEQVINSQKQSLLKKTELKDAFAGILSPKETIFGLYYKGFYDNVLKDLYQSITFYSLDPRYNIENIYQQNRTGNDYRWDEWFIPASQTSATRLKKITDIYQLNNKPCPAEVIQGINLIRLPEMYYIASEAALLKGDYPTALNYFNQVLESRGLTALDDRIPAETLTIDRIDEERYKEFIGEGQSFFHMKRRHLDIQDADGQLIKASPKIYNIEIPEQEFDYRK